MTTRLAGFYLQNVEKANAYQSQCQSLQTACELNPSLSTEIDIIGVRPDFHDDVAFDEGSHLGPTTLEHE